MTVDCGRAPRGRKAVFNPEKLLKIILLFCSFAVG